MRSKPRESRCGRFREFPIVRVEMPAFESGEASSAQAPDYRRQGEIGRRYIVLFRHDHEQRRGATLPIKAPGS